MSQENPKPAETTEPAPVPASAPATATLQPTPGVQPEKPIAEKRVPVPPSDSAPAVAVEKVVAKKEEPAPEPVPVAQSQEPVATAGEEKTVEKTISQLASFKEESNVVSELPEAQRKAHEELKELVREAMNKHEFTAPPPLPPEKASETEKKEEEKKEEKAEEKKEEVKDKEMKEEEKKKEEKEVKAEEKKQEEKKEVKAEEKKEEKREEKEEKKNEGTKEETKEEQPSAPTTSAPPAPTTQAKPEEKPAATVNIEKAFDVADQDASKTVETIKETVVHATAPEAAVPPPVAEAPKEAEPPLEPEEVFIWGIPLLQDERSDVILLKFLRARDFKVKDSFTMLKNTVRWRKEFKIDELLEEDLGNEFEKMIFLHGVDKQGHPVCYNSYSEFQNKELFANKEKRLKFLRWRIQFQEKCVRALDFGPTAKSTFVFISDFKNAPGLAKRALWQFFKHAVNLFEDNYPEFVAKEVFINVPWWYIPYYRTIRTFTAPRTKSKMVLAGPSKSADAIFRYIAPEQVPVEYGGLSKNGEQEFSSENSVTEVIIKPASKQIVDLPASDELGTLVWELRVLGSEVNYEAQFEPSTEGSYTVIVSKTRKISIIDEPVISDAFKVGEPGKVVITIDNQTSRKKKLLYRFKTKPTSD